MDDGDVKFRTFESDAGSTLCDVGVCRSIC